MISSKLRSILDAFKDSEVGRNREYKEEYRKEGTRGRRDNRLQDLNERQRMGELAGEEQPSSPPALH